MTEKKIMRILAIETSCDETAISVIEADEKTIRVLANPIISQVDIHKEYGGVFPALAKREHAKNLVPMLIESTKSLKSIKSIKSKVTDEEMQKLEKILEREPELLTAFKAYLETGEIPEIDAIAFTQGPGLAPALWVGVNFAKALSLVWGKPLIPINHMEGHLFSALIKGEEFPISGFELLKTPVLALLISGGHTQIVLSESFLHYKIIGETRDDAVGEAFDKAARVLGLPYPGGPEISKRAEIFRKSGKLSSGIYKLPRPMLNSPDFDFSFSGIKTAVLYMVQKIPEMTEDIREEISYEFEEAVTETLMKKMLSAGEQYNPKTFIMGGGVSANSHIQKSFKDTFSKHFSESAIYIPERSNSGDNALMIAIASFARASHDPSRIIPAGSPMIEEIEADGNMKL